MKITSAQVARLALAESMELLDRAVSDAVERQSKAREELEAAEANWRHWNTRRHLFTLAIKEPQP